MSSTPFIFTAVLLLILCSSPSLVSPQTLQGEGSEKRLLERRPLRETERVEKAVKGRGREGR